MLARDKHSSLLRKSVNYGQKRFITLAPGLQKSNFFLEGKRRNFFSFKTIKMTEATVDVNKKTFYNLLTIVFKVELPFL